MHQENRASRQLNTWAEIAAYLGVSIRTVQKYEKLSGLPVYRLPGEKARVWAMTAELEAWKSRMAALSAQERTAVGLDRGAAGAAAAMGGWRRSVAHRRTRFVALACAVAVVLCAAWWYRFVWLAGPPVGGRIEDNELVVTNANGAVLWRYAFSQPFGERAYRADTREWLAFSNLTPDEGPRILFTHRPVDWVNAGSTLYCFDEHGHLRWRFAPGREVQDARQRIPSLYLVHRVQTVPRPDGRGAFVVVSSQHPWSYTDQVVVLDDRGALRGEYWHAGYLMHMGHTDLDGDGTEEILLGGVNNGYQLATLVVLDPRKVSGASTQPEGDSHQFRGLATGTEKAVVLFPRACFSKRYEPFNQVYRLVVAPTSVLVEVTNAIGVPDGESPTVLYQLDRQFRVMQMTISTNFQKHHQQLHSRGLLDHDFTPREAEELRGITVIRPKGS